MTEPDHADKHAEALLKSGDQVELAKLLRELWALRLEVVAYRATQGMEKSRPPGEKP